MTDQPNPPTNLVHPAQTRTTAQVKFANGRSYEALVKTELRPEWTVWGDEAETYQTPDNQYSQRSEAVGWRLFEKPEADSPVIDSPTAL